MTDERLKIWIDLFKWFIVSVVIYAVTYTIDAGLKDRETGIRETAQYEKYLHYVLNTDSVNQRLALSKYFSIVLPSEPLRRQWGLYYDYCNMEKQRKDSLIQVGDTTKSPNKKLEIQQAVDDINSQINVALLKGPVKSAMDTNTTNTSLSAEILQADFNKDISISLDILAAPSFAQSTLIEIPGRSQIRLEGIVHNVPIGKGSELKGKRVSILVYITKSSSGVVNIKNLISSGKNSSLLNQFNVIGLNPQSNIEYFQIDIAFK